MFTMLKYEIRPITRKYQWLTWEIVFKYMLYILVLCAQICYSPLGCIGILENVAAEKDIFSQSLSL